MASASRLSKTLLSGLPGVGKTTVVDRLAQLLWEAGFRVGGFLTSEILVSGRRVGFVTRDFAGAEAVIAHRAFSTGISVGCYGVDVASFEQVALPALAAAAASDALIVDEIARMELASNRFVAALLSILDQPVPLVATVHVHGHPVTDAIKGRSEVEVIEVTEDSRDRLPAALLQRLTRR